MTIQDIQKFHLELLEQSKISPQLAEDRFTHVQDGSKEMARTMSLEAFKKASDALEYLMTYGSIPDEEPSNIRAVIVTVEGEEES